MSLGRARAGVRSGSVLLALSVAVVTSAISLSGCRNKKEEARQKAELTTALDQFKARIADLQKQTMALRTRFDRLPEDLPGIGGVRDNLHALEEVLGVEDGRAKWLAGKLDSAFVSGKKEEIEAVRNAIPRGNDETEQLLLRVTHQLLPFERVAGQRRVFEALDAANAKSADVRKQPPPKAR